MTFERITDPTQVKVQVNVRVPFATRERLHRIAKQRNASLNEVILEAIEAHYPER